MAAGWIIALALAPAAVLILGLVFISYYGTRMTFMVDQLMMYGGSITYQGIEYEIPLGSEIKVGMGSIVVTTPDGKSMKFTTGNAFTQQPIVKIYRRHDDE